MYVSMYVPEGWSLVLCSQIQPTEMAKMVATGDREAQVCVWLHKSKEPVLIRGVYVHSCIMRVYVCTYVPRGWSLVLCSQMQPLGTEELECMSSYTRVNRTSVDTGCIFTYLR